MTIVHVGIFRSSTILTNDGKNTFQGTKQHLEDEIIQQVVTI